MKKPTLNRIFYIVFFTSLIIISGCNNKIIPDSGFLEGKISIGPLCPVETYPPSPDCTPTIDTYNAYPVSVWTANARIKIAQVKPLPDGSFSVELIPGNYKILLEKDQSRIGASNLPADVSILSNEKTLLVINIDTGIR